MENYLFATSTVFNAKLINGLLLFGLATQALMGCCHILQSYSELSYLIWKFGQIHPYHLSRAKL